MTHPTPDTPARRFADQVARTLREAGHQALWAGGCVRDALLGKLPKDYDVATDATPDRVREVFGKRRTIAVGAAFGVITVLPKKGNGPPDEEAGADPIEVATFRADGDYGDGRRPDAVRFTSAEEDALRRDFTINGLFYDPLDGRVIDYVGGEADLAAGVVRAIGDPDERIGEDRLRMLRAVRFACSLGFRLDEATEAAVRRHAAAITAVSPERIGAEARRMLTERDPARAVRLLRDTGLLSAVLGPLAEAGDPAVEAAAERLARLDAPTAALALATALVGVADASAAAQVARSVKWTNKEADRASWLVASADSLEGADRRPWSEVQPLLVHEGGAELVALRAAARGEADAAERFCRERLAWPAERLDPPPLVVGADLIAAGLRPGPEFKRLLQRARDAQLDGEAGDKASAMAWLGLAER
ncbi:MAG: CCA tRNA nucleotidyltransferase [Planctomycetota bacterium]